MQRRLNFLVVLIVGAIVLSGCSEDEREDLIAEVNFTIDLPSLAPLSSISEITVTVMAGPNDSRVLAEIPLKIEGNKATGKGEVLAGKDRVFELEAKDSNGTVIGTGTAMADVVAGKTTTVNMPIVFATGEVVINAGWENGDDDDDDDDDVEPVEIIPGEEMAGVKLMEPFKAVRDLYGDPEEFADFPGFFVYEDIVLLGAVLDSDGDGRVDDNELVIILGVMEPYKGKTAGGNGINSRRSDVEKEFGTADEIEPPDEGLQLYDYTSKGIMFNYEVLTQRVVDITIYPVFDAAAPPKGGLRAYRNGIQLLRLRAGK